MTQPEAQRDFDSARLKVEFGEILDRVITVERLISYNSDELKYLIKVTMWKTKDAPRELSEAAEEFEIDINKKQNLRANYKMDSTNEDIN